MPVWIAGLVALVIYALIPLPIQLLIFVVDVITTGWGVDEILLIVGIILRRFAKG